MLLLGAVHNQVRQRLRVEAAAGHGKDALDPSRWDMFEPGEAFVTSRRARRCSQSVSGSGSRTLITAGTRASGRVVPIALVDGVGGVSCFRVAPVLTADLRKGSDPVELNGPARAACLSAHDWRISRAAFDVTVPNVARMYDYLLGGKDNFTADRDAAGQLLTVLPDVAVACRQNREFLRRAVRYLAAEAGIGQFVDIGSGLPTACNTHQIAQAARPGARVVYADNDPVVVAHGQVLLAESPDVAVIEADLRQPGDLVGHPLLRELVDLSEPTAFLLVAVLHFIQDDEDPYGIAGYLRSVMAPGSFLVISHATHDSVSREEYADGVSVYDKASAPVVPRRYDQVLKFFDGMDLVDPGLVGIGRWRAEGQPVRQLAYGGVARKPSGGRRMPRYPAAGVAGGGHEPG